MFARWAKILGTALITCSLLITPAYAQRKKGQELSSFGYFFDILGKFSARLEDFRFPFLLFHNTIDGP